MPEILNEKLLGLKLVICILTHPGDSDTPEDWETYTKVCFSKHKEETGFRKGENATPEAGDRDTNDICVSELDLNQYILK